MISKTVTQTQRFLRLPLEAQALYFHLVQNTDDDGVVEAFPIVRMIGASEDNVGLLVINHFITPLNDEMVYFVIDFHEQNKVRADRKVNSVYIDLLRNKLPEIELVEPKQRTDRSKKPPEKTGQPWDGHGTDKGQQNISQYNISKYNISQQLEVGAVENPIFEKLKEAFGEMAISGTIIQEVEDLLQTHGEALLLHALNETILNAGKSIRYTRRILENWQGQGLRTVEQIEANKRNYTAKGSMQRDRDWFQNLQPDEGAEF